MAAVNMEQFEAFFKRADLDGDGRISGAEAVSFFQAANLPKPVLAQIWTYADQNRTGFLGRPEFYNALRLVTVAQSKRDLTPDIVKAALYGPAAAKIPPPKINLPSTPAPQANPTPSGPMPRMGAVGPTASQHLGFQGPGVPNASVNQNYFTPQQGQLMRPPQATSGASPRAPVQSFAGQDFSRGGGMPGQSQPIPAGAASHPSLSMPSSTIGSNLSNISMSTGWSSGLGSGLSPASAGVTPSASPVTAPLKPLTPVSPQPAATGSKSVPVSGNGAANDPFFSGNLFPATQPPMPAFSATSTPVSSATVPVSTGSQILKSNSLDSLQSAFAMQPLGGKPSRTQSLPNTAQQASASPASSSIPVGVGNSSTPQIPWPKMKSTDIQKYTKVFLEVDTDRDGRITGEQARNLFLSWRLPREILKQVWDLSDQDSDSMLSLREFCFALYLMERYREGRPLPTALPNTIMYDETLLSMTGQLKAPQGVPAWGANSGFGQQPGMGPRQMGPATGLRQPAPVGGHQPVRPVMPNQQRTGAPVLEDSFLNQHDGADQSSANSMPQDGVPLEKKVDGPEKVILDSKEKIEFYRTKMQELVLYKSRCDNRLNEITERALADKREAEMLGKKYEEKYKQVAEVASKLTIEEAAYRDTQERKVELEQAIINMEKGGSVDGILQVRADRIQSDLDELLKALTERCKKHGLEVKSAAVIELPKGWQPGIREDAAVWDEEWDKFEDEGFTNELKVDVKNVPSPKQNGSLSPDFLSHDDEKGNIFNTSEHTLESGSAKTQSEDEFGKSTMDSPSERTASESPSRDFSDVFAKSSEADAETHRGFDDSTWGVFDGNDDADSVWGFNPSKESDSGKHGDFFGSSDFGGSTRTDSPTSESPFQKKSIFFEESVAGSPRYSEAGDHFDSFSRFDSFSMNEGGFSPQREKFTRFDSISSSKDFGHSGTSFSYDDTDPFGSSGPFKVSSSNQSPKKSSDNWSSF